MGELRGISLRERIRINLVSYMESANINQVQLAEKLGISKGTVNNWARGNNSPDVDMVPKICKVLGISILDLYSPTKFEVQETATQTRKAPSYSDEAMRLAQDYDKRMDSWGRKQVRDVADNEITRCTSEQQALKAAALQARQDQPEPDKVVYITNWFPMPMSAGTGQPAGSDEPEELELTKRPPRGTSYVAPVSGDSMEPTYHDGDKLFIRACEEIEVGQIGVFLMDGQQWVKERGDGVLISHNPAYAPRPFTEDIKCQGLVLGVCDESYFE